MSDLQMHKCQKLSEPIGKYAGIEESEDYSVILQKEGKRKPYKNGYIFFVTTLVKH